MDKENREALLNEMERLIDAGEKTVMGVLVNVEEGTVGAVTFVDKLDYIYALLNIDLIDVAVRKVGYKNYDFIVDDEGLLKGRAIPSVLDTKKEPMLVGNILIVNSNEEGEFTSLSIDDIRNIEQHLGNITFYDEEKDEERSAVVVANVEYC